MLSQQQEQLHYAAQSVIRRLFEAEQQLPCFALLSDSHGKLQELLPNYVPGEEEKSFNSLVDELQKAIAAGASSTALVILLEAPTESEPMSGATIDLEQAGFQRMMGFMPFSLTGSQVTFHDAQFTAKPAVLFRAP